MSIRKIALTAVFTFLTAGAALAQDTTAVDTTGTDSTSDSTTALSYGKRYSAFDLKKVGSGFTVSLEAASPVAFRLVDAHGRTVWAQTATPVAGRVTLSRNAGSGASLARGAYVLQAESVAGARRAPLFARRVLLDE